MSEPIAVAQPPTTENCRFCWMCRHVCPVGHVTSRETLTPHAWALTVASERRGQITWNAETAGVMYACADCGLCQRHCVTDQPLPDAIIAAREAIVRAGVAPPAVTTRERAARASLGGASHGAGAVSRAGHGTILFGGEALGDDDPVLQAAVTLLAAAGAAPPVIWSGRGTGQIESSLGLRGLARDLARSLLADIAASGAAEVFVCSPAERWTFEYVYPKRLGLAWPATVRITEVTTVLAAALDGGRLRVSRGIRGPVAYHDPCHSARVDRDHDAPRRLLAAACSEGARELFWRAERGHPCGATSGLDLTHPDLARDLASARFHDAVSAGATTVVTDDPACLAHLRRNRPAGVDVVGLYELVAKQLAI